MAEPKPTRPWWRKRRWRLALALWLALPVAYPLSVGPACYVGRAGWISVDVYNAVWGRPMEKYFPDSWKRATGYQWYFEGWAWLGRTHFPQ